MKKLLPLLLLGVTAVFFSCESYDKSEGKANAPVVSFEYSQEALPFMGQISVKVLLDKPATQKLTVPFIVLGDATENTDYKILDLPEGITAEERHVIIIPKGQTEAELILEHLKINASPRQTQFILQRSSDDSYQLGAKKQILVRVAQRENVKLSFVTDEYLAREYSLVELGVKLTGEETGTEYVAPEELDLNLSVVAVATSVNQAHITNAPRDSWEWDSDGSLVTIEQGTAEATKAMRIRYIDQKLPGHPLANEPIFPRGDDWPEGYNYRFAVTFNNPSNGFVFGGEVDTTYVYVKRIENVIEELLMPYKWINPTFGLDLTEALSGRQNLQRIMEITGDDSWGIMPRKRDYDDGFEFYSEPGDNEDFPTKYFVKVNAIQPDNPSAVYTNADTVNFSDFAKFFKSGRIFNRDENDNSFTYISLRFHPLGSNVPGIRLQMPANRNFLWSRVALTTPSEAVLNAGANIMLIPSAVAGDDDESYMDVIIYGGQWYTDNTNTNENNARRGLFLEKTHMYENPLTPNSYPYRDGRIYDVWFRIFRDKLVTP